MGEFPWWSEGRGRWQRQPWWERWPKWAVYPCVILVILAVNLLVPPLPDWVRILGGLP